MMRKLFDLENNDKNRGDKKITISEDVAESKDIAVIGVASLLPLADTPDKFWNNLVNGIDCVRTIPETRRRDIDKLMKYFGAGNVEYKEIAYLDEVDKFDYAFFGLSPKEASLMDPHQRLFLETAWKCIEDAGYGGDKLSGSRTGVFLGFSGDSAYMKLINEVLPQSVPVALTGNLASIIASRISYILDLKGPSVNIDTACSSSLVAVHYACESIRRGECSAAIAGSVKLQLLPMKNTYSIGINSSDGRTKTFDASSDGTGTGEGVVALMLKPLQKAAEDFDNIYAVIKGSAVNQDGASVGISAPNPAAQADVIFKAWENSQIDPMSISYIEAHGTGTKLGDPIEIEGLKRAFEKYTKQKNICAIGSVKTNIGHLDHAAGAAGLLKCIQALVYKKLPPLLHFREPNKNIDFINSPIYINKELNDWNTKGSGRKCGLSSFGFSGTNCHMILEEYIQPVSEDANDNEAGILTLSAKSEESLIQIVKNYINFFEAHKDINIHDVCYTANTGRGHYNLRIAIIFADSKDLLRKLRHIENEGFIEKTPADIYFGTSIVQNGSNIHDFGCEGSFAYFENLHKLCEVYVSGANLNWEELYNSQNRKRVSIPTYPFAKSRCWIGVPDKSKPVTQTENEKMFSRVTWEYTELLECAKTKSPQDIIILNHGMAVGTEIAEAYKAYNPLLEVMIIIENIREDFPKLINNMKHDGLLQIVFMVHMTGCPEDENQIKFRNEGIEKLINIVKACSKSNIDRELEIVIISSYVNEVTGREKVLYPENAIMMGLGKVIGTENFHISTRFIDIDDFTPVETVVNEIIYGQGEYCVAYRRNERFEEVIDHLNLNQFDCNRMGIREEGVYVITGGLGKIGIELSAYIAAKNKVKLALLSRSAISAAPAGEGIIARLKEIQSNGTEVVCISVDITDEKKMNSALEEIRNKYGKINGVFHAAAVGVGKVGTLISDEDIAEFDKVLAPKVQGAYIIDRLTRKDDLDFFVMFSSIATITGGRQAGAYVAANSFLDSFAYYRKKNGCMAHTFNWPVFKDTIGKTTIDSSTQMFDMLSNEGAFQRLELLMKFDVTRAVVGTIEYNKIVLFEKYLPFKLSRKICAEINKNKRSNEYDGEKSKVILIGKENSEYSKYEKMIAEIWGNELGLDQINVYDTFEDLGGNSIMAIKMETEFEKINLPVTVEDIFECGSIHSLAMFVSKQLGVKDASIDIMVSKQNKNKTLAEAAVMDEGIFIDNIMPFNELFYKSCFYNSLFPVIRHFRKSIELFLANDIIVYNYENVNTDIESKLNFSIEYIEKEEKTELLDQLGILYTGHKRSLNLTEDLENAINLNRPAIIWVDCYYESFRVDAYNKQHIAHTLLVYGYSHKKQQFHVFEQINRNSLTYQHTVIGYKEMAECYEGFINNFHSDEYTLYEFYTNTDKNNYEIVDNQSLASIKKNFANYLKDNRNKLFTSIRNLDYFESDYIELIRDEACLQKNAQDLYLRLNTVIDAKRVEKYRLSKLFDDSEAITVLIEKIIQEWEFIRKIISVYAFTGKYKIDSLSKTLKNIESIKKFEYEYCNALAVYLDNMGSFI